MTNLIIWKRKIDVNLINEQMKNTMMSYLGIKIDEIGNNYIKGRMPVNNKTKQPFGILHGGASVVLAESLGSIAANLCIETNKRAVGLDINANHIKPVTKGNVIGIAKYLHIGKTTQVWEIKIYSKKNIICIARLTTYTMKNVPS